MYSFANNWRFFLSMVLIPLLSDCVNAQRDLPFIVERLSEQLPQEKVFLSFNKPQYTEGDYMYFKAFLMSARSHAADSLSGVLYVDILDENGKTVVAHTMHQIVNSISFGSIETKGLKGNFVIHAYTQWMLNQSSAYNFNKKICINAFDNLMRSDVENIPAKENKIFLSFFPEGGNLVAGLLSKVAFKAVNQDGNGVPVNGVIVDDKGEGVVVFKDEYLGMGSYSFTPVYGRKYVARVKAIDESITEYPLPNAIDLGYVIAVDNLKDKEQVKVVIQTNMPDVAMPKTIYLLAHTRGTINHVMQLEVLDKKNKTFVLNIPKEKLDKDGIVHITLFNEKGQPLAERLIFVESKKSRLFVNLKTDKTSYKPREKVIVDFEVKDCDGNPCEAEIAIAITNGNKVKTTQYGENLLSYALFRSDLGQNIDMPTYYLQDTSRKGKRALDHLMMTNGWRRFVWKEILEQDRAPTPSYLPELGLSVRGNVNDNQKAITNASLLATLFNESEGNQPFFIESDRKGNFKLNNVFFKDSAKVFLQVIDRKKSFNFNVETQKNFTVKTPSIVYTETISQKMSDYLAAVKDEVAALKMQNIKEIELSTLEVKAKKMKKADSRAIYGNAETTLEIEQGSASGYNNIIDYLNGRGGINVYEKDNAVYFRPFRGNSSIEGASQPLIMIDGFPVDAVLLKTIAMVDVEKVDIVKRGVALYGARGANGIVNVLTKTNSNGPKSKPKMTDETDLQSVVVKGYKMFKEFYSPDYSEFKKIHEISDNRTSLYWSPSVKTNKSGKTQIVFYNSDDSQTVKIFTELWEYKGKMGVGELEYSVKE